jgi:hypothetical protein
MRKITNENKGISVIVGALMLVVITVGAAVAFAAFISEQQGKYQQNQKLQQQSELENIVVTNIEFNTTDDILDNLIIKNVGIYEVDIWGIQINDFNVGSCKINGNDTMFDQTNVVKVESLNSIIVDINGCTEDNKEPLTITIWTKLRSHTQIFYLPIALIQLDLSPIYPEPQICDGTKSYCITNNSYIVQWNWTINTDPPTTPINKYGSKITTGFTSGTTYNITLEVTDNFGMKSTDTYSFTQS